MEFLDRIKQGHLPSMQEIDDYAEQYGFEAAQEIVAEIRRLFNGTELCKLWKTYNGKVVNFCLGKYQVTKVPITGDILVGQAALDFTNKRNLASSKNKKAETVFPTQFMPVAAETEHEHKPIEESKQSMGKVEGFQIQVAKECSSQDLNKLLDRITVFIDKEDYLRYYVDIVIKELPK